MIKKVISGFLSLSLIFVLAIPTYATSTENTQIELNPLFVQGMSNGTISLDSSGKIQVKTSEKVYNEIAEDMGMINELIDIGLYDAYLTETGELDLSLNKNFNDSPEPNFALSEFFSEHFLDNDSYSIHTAARAHSCSYEPLDLGDLVEANYTGLEDYYMWCIEQEVEYGVSMDPSVSTSAVWINSVREGGVWDYKVQLGGYEVTFCCDYDGGSNAHRTAEFIGNYNYGYTGSFLFSLDILFWGSAVVADDIRSEYKDRPVIEEVYDHAVARH